jgi:hypothetical protein
MVKWWFAAAELWYFGRRSISTGSSSRRFWKPVAALVVLGPKCSLRDSNKRLLVRDIMEVNCYIGWKSRKWICWCILRYLLRRLILVSWRPFTGWPIKRQQWCHFLLKFDNSIRYNVYLSTSMPKLFLFAYSTVIAAMIQLNSYHCNECTVRKSFLNQFLLDSVDCCFISGVMKRLRYFVIASCTENDCIIVRQSIALRVTGVSRIETIPGHKSTSSCGIVALLSPNEPSS